MTETIEKLIGLEDLQSPIRIAGKEENFTILRSGNRKYFAKMKLPVEGSTELASLIGHAIGDGHIKKNLSEFQYFNKSQDLIKHVKYCIKKVFDIELTEHFRTNSEIFELYSPSITARILAMTGAPIGRKTTQKIQIPTWILNNNEFKIAFIRALFDDEGWVGTTQGSFAIGFGQNKKPNLIENHRKFLNTIRNILLELGIETSKIYKRSEKLGSIQLGFKIIGRENIRKFSDIIGFNNSLKQNKSEKIICGYKQIQYSKGETKLKILSLLKNAKTSKELSILLNRNQKTIWKHLNQLHKKNLVIKIGTKNKVFWQLNEPSKDI